jgi:hypothetical protein
VPADDEPAQVIKTESKPPASDELLSEQGVTSQPEFPAVRFRGELSEYGHDGMEPPMQRHSGSARNRHNPRQVQIKAMAT